MTKRIWVGGSGLWTDPTQWIGGVAPMPGDSEVVSAGTVTIPSGGTFDAASVLLGSSVTGAPATFAASGTAFGSSFTIDSTGAAEAAALDITGAIGDFGTIDASASGGTFVIQAVAQGSTPGELVMLGFAQLEVSDGDTVVLDGTIANHGTITVGKTGTFLDDGTVTQAGGAFEVESGGTLAGSGAFDIGLYSSLYFQAGSAPSSQAVQFTDVGGRLLLATPANYTGEISNFQQGDLIDLTATVANSATYDALTGILTVSNNGAVVATLHVEGPASGAMTTASDGSGGTLIEVPGTLTRVKYTIAGDDRAMDAEQVRDSMTTASGTPITGAGVKIGIISDSFDADPGVGAADPANAAAIAGYLPLDAATDTCAVTVLSDAVGSGDDNEGMAMAEEVYQVAPGAQIDFAAGGNSLTSFASAVSSLQAAGCQVIVDDLSFYAAPDFQVAGPADTAIENAMAAGISYFTAAGNVGDASYQAAYAPQLVTLYNGKQTNAEVFSRSTPYQTITLLGGVTTTIALQWALPYGTTTTPLSMDLFSSTGTLVQQSTAVLGGAAEATLTIAPTTTTQYQLAILGSLAAGTEFKYVLFGSEGGGTTEGGTIDDPAADNAGTVSGQAMIPGVNAVGAIEYADTPAFGASAYYTEDYSANGPAELLYNSSGTALATPDVESEPAFVAPVGSATTVFAPFDGTSAAAPNAAAVAALMLQADPGLTPAQITTMLEQSADNLGLPADEQGAGLVQANQAVALALAAEAVPATLAIAATDANLPQSGSPTTPFTFTVTRAVNTTTTVSADWSVTGSGSDPATAADFVGDVLPSGTVDFTPGVTSQTITVNVADDTMAALDEGFTVTLSDPVGATIGTASAVGTILTTETSSSASEVIAAYDGILRTTPSSASIDQDVAQIDAGTLNLSQLDSQLIGQAWTSTVPALVSYDAFYGSTPTSGGLDYVTNYAAELPAQGFSVINVWVNLGASFAANGSFGAEYGSMTRDQFVTSAYSTIFGQAPSSDALSTLVNSMDFYETYAGSELGARGAVEGIMLYLAGQNPQSSYSVAATNFLEQAAAGTAQYQSNLLSTYGPNA